MKEIELCANCYKLSVLQPTDWFAVPCVSDTVYPCMYVLHVYKIICICGCLCEWYAHVCVHACMCMCGMYVCVLYVCVYCICICVYICLFYLGSTTSCGSCKSSWLSTLAC